MTTILPSARSPFDAIMEQVGSGLSQTLPQAAQQRSNREALQKSLASIKDISSNPNATNLDIMLSTLQAGAGIPGSERYMAQILPEILKQAESNRAQRSTMAGEAQPHGQNQMRDRTPLEPVAQRQQQPEFGNNRFFPTNKGPGAGPGHIPQEATTGNKLPLLAPNEKPMAIKKLIADNKAAGRILTVPEATEEINAYEEDKKLHNQAVDAELAQQVQGQKDYGKKAVDELNKVYKKKGVDEKGNPINIPAATPEIQAIFKKFGEEEATKGKSEAEIDRSLAVKAKNFSDAVANVKNDLSAPRLLNSIGRGLTGTYKNFEESSKDLRSKLKPLLDMGLYDTSRNLMSELGYYPEEIDITVNPLGEREQIALNKVSKIKTANSKNPSFLNPEPIRDQEAIKSGLRDLKKANPNFSLVLGRKAFEDKNYDWRMYKDALNELENEGFELTDDQQRQRGILDTPPLNMLESLLHSINIIGR